MLKTRVITAVVLVVLFLSAVHWLGATGWSLLTLATILLAAHEWCRLWSFAPAAEVVYLIVIASCGGAVLLLLPAHAASVPAYFAATLFWFIVVPVWFYSGWKRVSKSTAGVAGAVILLAAWLAMVDLRSLGELWLLGAMALVWVADISAYFAGRAFGRHRLAAAISPGKTWEGVAGAMVAVMLYAALVFALAQGALPAAETPNPGVWLALLVLAAIMCGISIVGDLFESAVKRLAGVKDSGVLLPGHGGVLDRVDALLPVLPLAALITMTFAGKQYAPT